MANMFVLSRLLPPTVYGIMAMAGVVTALAYMLRDMGTGAAVIQRKDLDDGFLDTVFWLNCGIGAGLALLLLAVSLPAGHYFGEAQLPGVVAALAMIFPVSSTATVHQALLERESRFKELAWLDIASQSSALILAVGLALAGFGVWSFVVSTIVSVGVSAAGLWLVSPWRPSFSWRQSETAALWRFSGGLTSFNLVNYLARNSDSLIIGRINGAAALGQYGMAYKLMLFPVQNMTWVAGRIMLPRLSRLQDDREELARVYFSTLGTIALASAPLMAGLWILSEPFVAVALGSNWSLVASILAWMAPVGLIQSMTSTFGVVLTATDNTPKLFRVGVVNTVIIVIALIVGARYGIVEVTQAYFAANVVNALIQSIVIRGILGGGLKRGGTELLPALTATAVMLGAIAALRLALNTYGPTPDIVKLVAGIGVGVVAYYMALRLLFPARLDAFMRIVRRKDSGSPEH